MSDTTELVAALAAVVGEEHVTTSASELDRHGHDESAHETVLPDAVVFPATTEQVAGVVRVCN
ncbi:MAG: FAD-binding oxidoreductase, partial [Thermoleophilia bacterium]|nr:FAD-binding oxidoreductase [Thermoleophilia bacterium]